MKKQLPRWKRNAEGKLLRKEVNREYEVRESPVGDILIPRGYVVEYVLSKKQEAPPDDPKKLKRWAHRRLQLAVRYGLIEKPASCSICNESFDESSDVRGHHNDYHKPLEVLWLCRKCHGQVHGTKKTL